MALLASVLKRTPKGHRDRSPRPWGPQMLGLLVLFLSFLMIYDTSQGARLLKAVDAAFSGAPTAATTTTTAGTLSDPSAALRSSLRTMRADVEAGDWTRTGSSLRVAEEAWARAQGAYARKGVTPTDLNGLTGDLAELQMDVARKDRQDALTQIQNAQKTFETMVALAMTGTSPSLDAMSRLVTDLQSALRDDDIPRARADAQALSSMLQSIHKGF